MKTDRPTDPQHLHLLGSFRSQKLILELRGKYIDGLLEKFSDPSVSLSVYFGIYQFIFPKSEDPKQFELGGSRDLIKYLILYRPPAFLV